MIRILDLGMHDGFVTLWVARQLRERGIEVQVDGLELHPGAADAARRRFAEEGIESTVVQGDALAAAEHFEPGTYDAVVAYELIEHVPDPPAFLAVCESMTKPEGRVYISTPEGTFGEGSNPHHLRVYRAQDLVDELRRRGSLEEMAVGMDGVSVASYSPAPRRGDVGIYLGAGWERFSPHDIETKGLGGSETAAVRLAEELSGLGYVVTVYAEVENCAFRDVLFRHHTAFDPMERREALILSRVPEIGDRHLNARVRMLWLHDTDCGDRLTRARADQLDHVLCLSHWQTQHVAGMYPFLRDKVRQTRNGITWPYFTRELEDPTRRQRLVYTSSPDRGLDILLELWPRIREQAPDAEFAHCYTAVYDRVAEADPAIAAHRDRIRELADQPGVEAVGPLSQPKLAELMRTSLVWAHPSWASALDERFFETSCIGAMEAQAAGCLVVASNWGALAETVRKGRLVNSQPGGPRWKDALVTHIVEGLTRSDVQDWIQEAAPAAVADLGWDGVARDVAGLIEGEADGAFRPPSPSRRRTV